MKEKMNELYKLTKRIKSGEVLSDDDHEKFIVLTDTVQSFIKNLDSDYASACLTERYINAKPWNKIADEMGQLTNDSVRKCCERTIRRYS